MMTRILIFFFISNFTISIYSQNRDNIVDFEYYGNNYSSLFKTNNWSNDTTATYYISYRYSCSKLIAQNGDYWKRDSLFRNGFRNNFIYNNIKYCKIDSKISKEFIIGNFGNPDYCEENVIGYKYDERKEIDSKTNKVFLVKRDYIYFIFKNNVLKKIRLEYYEP